MKAVINGLNLGYDVFGQSGPPLVLIHGFGLDRSIWREMVFEFISDQHVILIDVRGHGESDAPSGPYLIEELADDLAGLLAFLQIDKAIVCGHSMGGYISLAFADLYPQGLLGLGLITTNAKADSDVKKKSRYTLIEQVKVHGSGELAKSLAPRLSQNETIIKRAHALIKNTSPTGIIGSAYAMAERPDRMALVQKLALPAFVAAGEEDQIADLADTMKLADAFSNGRFLTIPNAGHMPMWENPACLAEGILDLIKRVSVGL
jgi:pimeloyl-ACP methyl ester carboxylesterase